MQIARTLLVAIVCVGFTPGLGELISDSVHLLRSGHSHHGEHSHHAHAASERAHADHADPRDPDTRRPTHGHGHGSQPEHGCSGTQHSCPCHSSLTIAPGIAYADVPGAELTAVGVALPIVTQGPAGVRAQLDRPPRA